jgi:hypothetical protein
LSIHINHYILYIHIIKQDEIQFRRRRSPQLQSVRAIITKFGQPTSKSQCVSD